MSGQFLSMFSEGPALRLAYGTCFTGGGCAALYIDACAFLAQGAGQNGNAAGSHYVYVSSTIQVVFQHCTFEGKSPATLEWVVVSAAEDVQFDTCWFEDDGQGTSAYTPTYFIRLKPPCRGGGILNCHFVRNGNNQGLLRLIQLDAGAESAPAVSGLVIANPYAISATRVLNGTGTAFLDLAPIDLGGDTNSDIAIGGSGVIWDQQLPPSPPPRPYALSYANIPRLCVMTGGVLRKIPKIRLFRESCGCIQCLIAAPVG